MCSAPETRPSLLIRVRDPADQAAWQEFVEIYRPVILRTVADGAPLAMPNRPCRSPAFGRGAGVRAARKSRNNFTKGTLLMLTLLVISLFAVGIVSTSPPDISGQWQGDDWGQVTLTQTAPGEYTGTYMDTVANEKGLGKIDLKWSRIERRYNGTWREGGDDRFGDLSIHLVGNEIRGALTTDAMSKINPATPRLADLVWTRAENREATCVPNGASASEAVVWSVANGGNGHWYRVVSVPGGITWTDAKKAAESAGGYLATITSAEENAFVYSLADDDRFWHLTGPSNDGPWLGGAYDKETKAWRWNTGEAWNYTNWFPGQPDHLSLPTRTFPQDRFHFYGGAYKRTPMWGDNWHDNPNPVAYVVEWNTQPEPSVSTTQSHALQFDGASDYVDLGDALNFKKDSPFSVSFWIKSSGVDAHMMDSIRRGEWRGKMNDNVDQQIIGKGASFLDHGAPGWTIFTNKIGFLYFQLNASNRFSVSELQAYELRTSITDGRWHHVIVSYDGNQDVSGVAFYIDGTLQPLGNDSNNLRDGDIRNEVHASIGATATGKGFYHGALNDVQIFDRALTAADTAKLYSNGTGDHGTAVVSGLVASYHLDEGRGTTVADFSGHGHDGTLHGGVTWVPGRETVEDPHPRAVQFDGRHYAKLEPPPKFTSGDFTISLWCNPTTAGKSKMLFHRGFGYRDQPGDIDMHLNVYSGDLDFQTRTAENQWLFGWDIPESRLHSPVRYGQWNHVVVTRRGETYMMWMNGERVGSEKSSADISDADNTNPFIVGGIMEVNGPVDLFQGALDDFRIFGRCLSDKEMADLYKSNGDKAALKGEGRLKIGPLIEADAHRVRTRDP
jgi:hypothetical protein